MTAAVVWTYWLAVPLLVAGLAAVFVMAWLYYRRVLVPQYEWRVQQQLRVPRPASSSGADLRTLRDWRAEEGARAAA